MQGCLGSSSHEPQPLVSYPMACGRGGQLLVGGANKGKERRPNRTSEGHLRVVRCSWQLNLEGEALPPQSHFGRQAHSQVLEVTWHQHGAVVAQVEVVGDALGGHHQGQLAWVDLHSMSALTATASSTCETGQPTSCSTGDT